TSAESSTRFFAASRSGSGNEIIRHYVDRRGTRGAASSRTCSCFWVDCCCCHEPWRYLCFRGCDPSLPRKRRKGSPARATLTPTWGSCERKCRPIVRRSPFDAGFFVHFRSYFCHDHHKGFLLDQCHRRRRPATSGTFSSASAFTRLAPAI